MLETFRKHHKVMMIVVAAIVIVAFTFLYSPTRDTFGRGGGTVATLNGEALTGNDAEALFRQLGMAGQLSMMGGGTGGQDIMTDFGGMAWQGRVFGGISQIVDLLQPKDRNEMDLDGPLNVALLRQEGLRLGVDVEREDLEKAIKDLGAFKTNNAFDDSKLNSFLDSGAHGDRPTTESKLLTVVRDALLYQRLGELVGGTWSPSQAKVDNSYAQQNTRTTAQTALVEKKSYENQTVSDEDVKKYYDEEKAKQDVINSDDKEPKPGADASLLTEEKRTVKYVVTTAVKPLDAPIAPIPPTPVPPLEDTSKLPEDQKKAKEEEHKKLTDDYNAKNTEYDAKVAEHTKALEAHAAKVKETEEAKKQWLENLSNFSSALADTDARNDKSFEEVAKEFKLEAKTATFTRTTLPDDLKATVVAPVPTPGRAPQSAAFNPADGIFASGEGNDDIASPQDQSLFCIWVVEDIEAPAMKPLEEVKAAVSEKLKTDKINAALKAAGDDARSKMMEALKGGKPFKEAATAAALNAVEVPPFSNKKPVSEAAPNGSIIKSIADALNKGDLSEAVTVPEGLLFVFVEKKDLPNDPKMADNKKNMITSQSMKGSDSPLFRAWFLARRSAATAVTME